MDDERVVAGLHCGEVLADLTEYVEGWLGQDRSQRLGEHLRGCEGCRRLLHDLGLVIRAVRALPEQPLAPDVEARLQTSLNPEDAPPLG
ncbi:MAG TPA: zf-HC2 domain-containing protein [Thermoanaerobaculia bacterium]